MKTEIFLVIFAFVLSGESLPAQTHADDFFPLAVGNSWTYNYSGSDDEELNEYRTSDSGLATYKILSQSLSPDSIIWTVQEVRNIVHHYNFYFPPIFDTIYTIRDTIVFPIIEYQNNNHRLVSWATNWESVFYFRPELTDSINLFRYYPSQMSDTFSVVLRTSYIGEIFRTSFQRGVGLTMAAFSRLGIRDGFRLHITRYKAHI